MDTGELPPDARVLVSRPVGPERVPAPCPSPKPVGDPDVDVGTLAELKVANAQRHSEAQVLETHLENAIRQQIARHRRQQGPLRTSPGPLAFLCNRRDSATAAEPKSPGPLRTWMHRLGWDVALPRVRLEGPH